MEKEIGRQRHAPCLDSGTCCTEFLSSVLNRIVDPGPQPLGEVHMAPALVHMIDHKPGYRCDIAVPRPDRPVRMAISACADENA